MQNWDKMPPWRDQLRILFSKIAISSERTNIFSSISQSICLQPKLEWLIRVILYWILSNIDAWAAIIYLCFSPIVHEYLIPLTMFLPPSLYFQLLEDCGHTVGTQCLSINIYLVSKWMKKHIIAQTLQHWLMPPEVQFLPVSSQFFRNS